MAEKCSSNDEVLTNISIISESITPYNLMHSEKSLIVTSLLHCKMERLDMKIAESNHHVYFDQIVNRNGICIIYVLLANGTHTHTLAVLFDEISKKVDAALWSR